MPSTTANSSEDPQHVLDEINYQFRLKPETLQALTRAFLDEFAQGLSSYNHPMAMMYDFLQFSMLQSHPITPTARLSLLEFPMALKQGTWGSHTSGSLILRCS